MSGEPPFAQFSVHVEAAARTYIVTPLGELDVLTENRLRQAIDACPPDCELLVLDLRGLTFFDTTGMRLVVETKQRADDDQLGFALIRGSGAIQRIFALAGMHDRLPFLDDPRQALGR